MWFGLLVVAVFVVLIAVALASRYRSGSFMAASGSSPGAAGSLVPEDSVGRSPVSASEELIYEAGYQASLTRTLGFWLWGAIAATLIPFFWGAFGLFLFAGIGVLLLAVPIRLVLWHRRYGQLPACDELKEARRTVMQGLFLWALSPLVVLVVLMVTANLIVPSLR